MTSPKLSICIPTFNRAHLLSDLLECLSAELHGTGGLVEVVVCDNCSEDHTGDLVRSFERKLNLRYFRNDRNIGAAANVLNLPNHALGDFCWFIGDDDLFVPGAIALVLKHIQDNPDEAGIVVGYAYVDTKERKAIIDRENRPAFFQRSVYLDTNINQKVELWENTLLFSDVAALQTACVSCIFNRCLWIVCRGALDAWHLEPALTSLESTFPHTVVWARMFVGKPVHFISQPLVYFFVGEQEWFKPKWGTIQFSFCLQLAQFFRTLAPPPYSSSVELR